MLKNHYKVELNYPLKSLSWYGDQLIDIVGGHVLIDFDGNVSDPRIGYSGFPFDGIIMSSCSKYAVIFETFGTKGLLLEDLKAIREINRSYYCSRSFEFPVSFLERKGQPPLLVYCPDQYNVLEVEEFHSGQRLGVNSNREPEDFFFSRFVMSPDSQHFINLGWQWHPVELSRLFSVSNLLSDVSYADKGDELRWFQLMEHDNDGWYRIPTACFIDSKTICIYTTNLEANPGEGSLDLVDIKTNKILRRVETDILMGMIYPLSSSHVLNLNGEISIVNLVTGQIDYKVEGVSAPNRDSVIGSSKDMFPLMAYKRDKRRLAVTNDKQLHILEFEKNPTKRPGFMNFPIPSLPDVFR